MYAGHSSIVRKYFRHCIRGKNTRWPPFGQVFRHNRGIFLFCLCLSWGFQVCRTLWCCRKYFRHCIVSEISKMAAIFSRLSNKLISFRHNRRRFVLLVSIMWFSGKPDIAMWVKNPRWPPFVQGQTINGHLFLQNRYRFVILVSTTVF